MSYGSTPVTSGATSSITTTTTASLPSLQGASGSNTGAVGLAEFTIYPQATSFIPGIQGFQGTATPITDRQVTAIHAPPFLPPFHQWATKTPPESRKKIDVAYAVLKNGRFEDAENAFWIIINEHLLTLEMIDYQSVIIGLARSLKDQTRAKQEQARLLLEELRMSRTLNSFDASIIHNLDLTLSLCEQALGRYLDAEARLLRLRRKKPSHSRKILVRTSRDFDVDIANARLWQFTGKHKLAQALLLNVKIELIYQLRSNPTSDAVKKLHKQLHVVNIALARLWQEMGCYELAQDLLLSMSNKNRDDSEEILCTTSGDIDTDLALARLWRLMGKNELAERLLLNMSGKHPDASEEELCQPSGHLDTDLTLVRQWEENGKSHLAERLLLNLSGKRPNASKEELCQPCGHHSIDLIRALLWQTMDKFELTERLLLNMSNKSPYHHEEILCTPCGHHETDLALVRFWELVGKYELAEKLLLNMLGKRLDASLEELCKPCGHNGMDLVLALLWQLMDKYELSERLLLNASGKGFSSSEESLCTACGLYKIDLSLVRNWETTGKYQWAERLLLDTIGKRPDDNEDWLCTPSGDHDTDLALLRIWRANGKQKQAETLVERCYPLYRTDEFKSVRLGLFIGQPNFMAMDADYPESVSTLLKTSVHYFTLACHQVNDDDMESGISNLNKSLELVELILKKYPPSASAYSHKAHCIRMLGGSEKEWRELFNKADALDGNRPQRDKTRAWRKDESDALKKMLSREF
ncbi:hypothetical protein [Endozoicomonas sp. 4G]|uniref:hypothetical protein n=1 Tax=Endozoicomonas sp. 4G TaxID=2872754 RepID=UPI002079007C|nr:hypothetical protein [Endozoicomonas sp. 4G]